MYVGGRPGRADEGTDRHRAAGPRVRRRICSCIANSARQGDDAAGRVSLIVAAIVAPWYAALYPAHGWAPHRLVLHRRERRRGTPRASALQHRGRSFYLPVVFSDSFPWSLFLVCGGGRRGCATCEPSGPELIHRAGEGQLRIRTLLWLWIARHRGVLHVSASQAGSLHLPDRAGRRRAGRCRHREARANSRSMALSVDGGGHAACIVALAGGGVVYLFASARTCVYVIAGHGRSGSRGGSVASRRSSCGGPAGSDARCARQSAAVFIMLDWMFVLRVLPGFERYKPVPGFAQAPADRAGPDDVIATYDERAAEPGVLPAPSRRSCGSIPSSCSRAAVPIGRTVYAILTEENYAAMAPALGVPTCVIDRRPTFDVKLKNMLARDPLPELVLITNKCNVSRQLTASTSVTGWKRSGGGSGSEAASWKLEAGSLDLKLELEAVSSVPRRLTDRRPELAHDDPRRAVGEARGVRQRRASGKPERDRADHRVARAGDVGDFARFRRQLYLVSAVDAATSRARRA